MPGAEPLLNPSIQTAELVKVPLRRAGGYRQSSDGAPGKAYPGNELSVRVHFLALPTPNCADNFLGGSH